MRCGLMIKRNSERLTRLTGENGELQEQFSQDDIRSQLGRIVAGATFRQATRMCRFLRMVVEFTLEGRGGELKEYAIGIEVFDRKDTFDPRMDPIVRVEARRLRTKLSAYYAAEGSADQIRVELPKGSYVAHFTRCVITPPAGIPAEARDPAVAVMPLANLSPGDGGEYFSDGLTQELILGLTRVTGLRVVAWTSALRLRGLQDYTEIGKQLKVGAVLTGSVRQTGRHVRVAVQLIATDDSSYLWSEAFDREVTDLFQIQDDISRAIVNTLRIKLADTISLAAHRGSAYNFDAHRLFLKGRFERDKRTQEGLRTSVQCFEEAIRKEAKFALAWAGLADSWALMSDYGIVAPDEAMPLSKQAALRAIDLEPRLGEAWTSLALMQGHYEWDRVAAEQSYQRALELNPGYSTVHHWYAVDHLVLLGRFNEAEGEIGVARMLDPLSTIIIEGEGAIQMMRRRYDAAIGKYHEALERARTLGGDLPSILGALAQAFGLAGNHSRAREILARLDQRARSETVTETSRAIAELGLGEYEAALGRLERACEKRETALNALKVHPAYDALRGSDRFEALLARVRLR